MFKKWWFWALVLGGGIWWWSRSSKASQDVSQLVGFVRSKLMAAGVQGIPAQLNAVTLADGSIAVQGQYGGNPTFTFLQGKNVQDAFLKAQTITASTWPVL